MSTQYTVRMPAGFLLLETMKQKERIKNTADKDDLAKVFRANGMKSVDKAIIAMNPDEFAEKHLEVILDILRQTKRPLEKMMAQSLRDATDNVVPMDLATKFARSICDVMEHCRSKKKNMVNGARLPQHIKAIIDQMDKPSDLGAKAGRVAERLEAPLPVRSPSSGSKDDQNALATEIVDSYKLSLPSSSKAAKIDKRKVLETSSPNHRRKVLLQPRGLVELG